MESSGAGDPTETAQEQRRPRILIIDDDAVDRMAITRGLRTEGIRAEYVEVDGARRALEHLEAEAFDCVFLDFHLPDRNGLEVLREIRQKGIRTPVIMLTGHGDEELAVQLMKAGATDHVPKGTADAERLAQSFRTVMRIQRAEARVREAEDAREAALAARSRFYAAMSHELRTPINAILGYNDLLLASVYGPLNEKQTAGLEGAQRAARHLLELVNDVLDLSKLEAGKMELQMEEVRIADVVEDLFATILPLATERGCELSFTDDGCPAIITDPRRVRQVLLNLLSNAIKYGAGKPVEVRCVAEDEGGAVIAVRDLGHGIAPADLRRVFEDFVQLGEAPGGGTGLGLPISKSLAELLHGRLDAESAVGEGSTFRLILPARPREGAGLPIPDDTSNDISIVTSN
jgi:signal transduction histidine kinase